jgi:murein DD-endopeptidase MepM/ murein hydrolase activator NlpD
MARRRASPYQSFLGFGATLACILASTLISVPRAAASGGANQPAQADAQLASLVQRVKIERGALDRLSMRSARLAVKRDEAQASWERVSEALRLTRMTVYRARERYIELQDELDRRAREIFIDGPATQIELLFGATSMADLSDRIVFADAMATSDAELAVEVQTVKRDLFEEAVIESKLQQRAADALAALNTATAALEDRLKQQQRLVDDIKAKIRQARQLSQLTGTPGPGSLALVQFYPEHELEVCPVDQPRVVYDGFGAPRYAGGYHPHAGNDIVAPMGTPIRAPFDGTARSSWNPLGGNSEYVYGRDGYVYNAHLSGYSPNSNGPVAAGDIIGYVGNTGDAQGGITHDHFEWHPNAIPLHWPTSPYGYRVIGTAVNPYPLLQQVC